MGTSFVRSLQSFVALVLLSKLTLGCALLSNEPEEKEGKGRIVSAPSSSAYQLIDQGQYQKALSRIDQDLKSQPIGPRTVTHQYAASLALIGLARFDEALERLDVVLKLTEKKDGQLFTEALIQRGRALEGVGNDARALAAYMDARSRKSFLKPEVAEVELPVRIANVYIRMNQSRTAEGFYRQADRALQKLSKQNSGAAWIPRALFNMGKSSPREIGTEDFKTGLVAFRRAQSYLVRSLEMGQEPWARRSREELEWSLQSAWRTIEAVPLISSGDSIADLRQQQDTRLEMALTLSAVVVGLQKDFLPGVSDRSPESSKFQEFLEGYQKRLDALLQTRPAQEGLTPEAQKRQGILRDGKVIDPEGRLEIRKKKERK